MPYVIRSNIHTDRFFDEANEAWVPKEQATIYRNYHDATSVIPGNIRLTECIVCRADSLLSELVTHNGAGAKDDSGKAAIGLIPTKALLGIGRVLTYGAYEAPRPDGTKGYGRNNWQQVENGKSRYFDAAMRHLLAWRSGEQNDSQSKLSHLWHAATNICFLISFEEGHDPEL